VSLKTVIKFIVHEKMHVVVIFMVQTGKFCSFFVNFECS